MTAFVCFAPPQVGPFIGDALQPSTAYLCNVGISVLYFIACCMLPESLPISARVPFHTRDLSPFRGFNVLYRYTMFRRLALVVFVSEFVQRGKFAVNFSFMKAEFGITEGFYAIVAAVFGTAGVISQSVVLKALVKRITNQRIMLIGLVATALNFAAYDFIWESWMVFPVEIFACFSFISFPAISAMKSNNVGETEQGKIQGALYGVKQFGGGLGPVVFGAVFNQFTGSHAVWYNPRFICEWRQRQQQWACKALAGRQRARVQRDSGARLADRSAVLLLFVFLVCACAQGTSPLSSP